MKTHLTSLIALVAATMIAGCAKAPKCSDEETFTLVRQIIGEQLSLPKEVGEKDLRDNIKFDLPRASAYDEKIKKYSCEAKLIVADAYQVPIRYESQLDDSNQHIVSVAGIAVGDLYAVRGAIMGALEKSHPAESASAAPAPAPAEAVVPAQAVAPVVEQQATPDKTWAPGFDCSKASTYAEKTICSEPLLGRLDGALSESYGYMLGSDVGEGARNELKLTQRKWLAERGKCRDVQCLTDSYRKRMAEVCDYPVISGVHPECNTFDDVK